MRAGVYGRQSRGSRKSIEDQISAGHEVLADHGWTLADTYTDQVSASRYSSRTRDDWNRLLGDLRAGALDVLVMWESSRGDRKLTTWSALLDTCRERAVKIHVVSHERTYDMARHRDWETLATDGVKSEAEVNLLSVRTRRGVASSARQGRPAAGPCPYGYRRTYDPATGALVGQEPDPATAVVVRELFARVATHEPLARIVNDLNARGVTPPSGGPRWYRQRVRLIVLSRTYLGERKHRDAWHPAAWPALVDAATYYAAVRVLTTPARMAQARPGRQKHLLTYYATCGKCGQTLGSREGKYACHQGCILLKMEPADELVTELVFARLADPAVYAALTQHDAAQAVQLADARALVDEVQHRLDELRLSVARGETSLASLAAIEPVLTDQLQAAQARVEALALPEALHGFVGPLADVQARWQVAPVQARRAVLRALGLQVVMHPAGQNAYRPVHERLDVSWGPAVG